MATIHPECLWYDPVTNTIYCPINYMKILDNIASRLTYIGEM